MAAINPQVVTYLHVAIYTRISKDKYGNAETCFDQENLGRPYAARTWPGVPIVVYSDPDLSAFKDDVYRPGFEALKEALEAGLVVGLWAVEQSRLERQEIPWFKLAALLDTAGIELLHTHRDGIVRVQDEVAGIKAVLNAAEIRKMKKRIADKLDAHAVRGLPPGSRPFGFVHGLNAAGERTYLHVPEQAQAIRDAAEMVLTGWSLEKIAEVMRSRGLHGAHRVKVRDSDGEVVLDERGDPVKAWSEILGQSVKDWLTNPSVAGIRVHRKAEVGKGNWEPILDEATFRQVRTLLGGPRQVTTKDGRTYPVTAQHKGPGSGRRYLLTGGTARCGVCTAQLIGTEKQLRNKSRGVYTKPYLICHPKYDGRGCIGIMLPETEEFVVTELMEEIKRRRDDGRVDDGGIGARRDEITTELSGLEEQRRELARLWASKQLTAAEWAEARAGLDSEQRRLETELRHLPVPSQTRDPSTVLEGWVQMPLDERRQVIHDYIESVTINRARPGLQKFDTGRVSIKWRELMVAGPA